MLHNTPNQQSKYRTKTRVKINDDSHGTYNSNSQIKYKTLILKLILCYYSDEYILVSGTITVPNAGKQKTQITEKI